jgi:hypothetical protein
MEMEFHLYVLGPGFLFIIYVNISLIAAPCIRWLVAGLLPLRKFLFRNIAESATSGIGLSRNLY